MIPRGCFYMASFPEQMGGVQWSWFGLATPISGWRWGGTSKLNTPAASLTKNCPMSNSSRNENGTGSVINSTLNGGSTFVDAATFREKSNTSWPSDISQDSSAFASLCRIRSSHYGCVENSGPLSISECAENGDETPQKNQRVEQTADPPNNNAAIKSYTKRFCKRISSFFSLNHLLPSTRKRNALSSANSSQNNDKVIENKKPKLS
ncbi:hypothetical protein DdX_01758 [Ditylenchus destructor]|uniref:Uncharacterized protein n=1 Tax=Ditylenchus destructor TaxID=166010 RepID=A0AAD4RE04_9BILA|nr:hypothetical protein DdX_01758 [Ditylenchus destructor]